MSISDAQRRLVLHGSIILLIGLSCGIPAVVEVLGAFLSAALIGSGAANALRGSRSGNLASSDEPRLTETRV